MRDHDVEDWALGNHPRRGTAGGFDPRHGGFDPGRGVNLTQGVLARRVVSWLADCVVVGLLLFGLHLALLAFGLLTLGLGLPLLGLLPAVPFLYTWLCVASTGATPGQALAGVSVRDAATLARPTGLQALLYTTGYWLTLATGGLLLLVALVTPRHRALHDMLAGVTVFRADALTLPARRAA